MDNNNPNKYPSGRQKKNVTRINVKSGNNNAADSSLLFVLNRIANALEERNVYEQKIMKIEEKLKMLELKEAKENYKMLLENKNKNNDNES